MVALGADRADDQHHDTGRLALAVGILVDEATVEVENITRSSSILRYCPRRPGGNAQTGCAALARHACFGVSFFVLYARGGTRFFVPLSLAVGFQWLPRIYSPAVLFRCCPSGCCVIITRTLPANGWSRRASFRRLRWVLRALLGLGWILVPV